MIAQFPPSRLRRFHSPESFLQSHASEHFPIRHYRSFLLSRCTLLAFGSTSACARGRRKQSTQRFRANLGQTVMFRSLFSAFASVLPDKSMTLCLLFLAHNCIKCIHVPSAWILLASTLLFVGPPSISSLPYRGLLDTPQSWLPREGLLRF